MAKYENARNLAGTIQSWITIIAILAGGIWFIFRGEAETRANISHAVTHVQITKDWVWVHVASKIENVGNTNLNLDSGIMRLQKILPLDSRISAKIEAKSSPIDEDYIVPWPTIGPSYELEKIAVKIAPGEEETLEHEFIIPSYVETVKIYSFIGKKGEPIGWHRTTIYHLKTEEGGNR